MGYIPWYITVIRLIIPISILRFPLFGVLASMAVDSFDWVIIHVTSNEMDAVYQTWDKALDLYSFFYIVWIVRQWKDVWARRVSLGFFGYRVIGLIVFWVTEWRQILFFFPNVFENFVILCLIIFWLSKKRDLNFGLWQKVIMLGVLIIPKMIQEYFQHFLGRQPWEIYPFGSWLGFKDAVLDQANWILWGILLYVVPMAGFLLYIRNKTK